MMGHVSRPTIVVRHPPAALVDVAIKLLQHGVPVCFASGRGSSMFDPLRDLLPKHLWSATIVATHNGALIQSLDSAYLDEEGTLIENQTSQHFLRTFERAGLSLLADVHLHAQQYSILPKHTTRVDFLWRAVQELCQASEINVEVRSTGHSVDVVPSKHDKAIVLKYLHERHNILPEEVLCIGDQGRWPGNDFKFLATDYGLTVGEPSADLRTCWNLAPFGTTGHNATVYYLSRLTPIEGHSFTFTPEPLV